MDENSPYRPPRGGRSLPGVDQLEDSGGSAAEAGCRSEVKFSGGRAREVHSAHEDTPGVPASSCSARSWRYSGKRKTRLGLSASRPLGLAA